MHSRQKIGNARSLALFLVGFWFGLTARSQRSHSTSGEGDQIATRNLTIFTGLPRYDSVDYEQRSALCFEVQTSEILTEDSKNQKTMPTTE